MKKNSKLYTIISSFNKQEQIQVQKFLSSPFFNQRQDVISLYNLLCKHPDYTSAQLYTSLYPHKVFNDQKFRLVKSYLFQLLEKYLAHKTFAEDKHWQQTAISKAYQKKGLPQLHKKNEVQLLKDLNKSPYRNIDYYQKLYNYQWLQYSQRPQNIPNDTQLLHNIATNNNTLYFAKVLRIACLNAAHQSIYHYSTAIPFLSTTIQYIEDQQLIDIPVIGMYYAAYKMTTSQTSNTYFHQLKNQLLSNGELLPPDEIRDLYLMAINYSVRQLNDGQQSFYKETFDLYKNGLEQEYLLENGMLSRFTYHNVVATGLKLTYYDWVEQFIFNYKNKLERKHRESSYSFNLARLEFDRKNYDIVLSLLQKTNYRDILLNLSAKTLLLKTYFAINERTILEAHLDAMSNYIRRKKIIGYHKNNYQNIIRFTKKMLHINPYDKSDTQQLIMQIQQEEILTEKNWLLQQLTSS